MGILSRCRWFGTALLSLVCICISFILPAVQRKASQKRLMQIAHYRNPHRVTWCGTTDIYLLRIPMANQFGMVFRHRYNVVAGTFKVDYSLVMFVWSRVQVRINFARARSSSSPQRIRYSSSWSWLLFLVGQTQALKDNAQLFYSKLFKCISPSITVTLF